MEYRIFNKGKKDPSPSEAVPHYIDPDDELTEKIDMSQTPSCKRPGHDDVPGSRPVGPRATTVEIHRDRAAARLRQEARRRKAG
jgi:hypothetical protein